MAKRSSKSKRIRLLAIAAALSTGGIVIALLPSANADQKAPQPSAQTADPDAGNKHFIHIATHGLPRWKGEAWLKDGKGQEVYHWKEGPKSGDYALWYFTNGGDGGTIRVKVTESIQGMHVDKEFPLNRDQCFLVTANRHVRYTGDNVDGGCTPD